MAIDDEAQRRIGERIRTARHQRRMTLQGLAAELGLSYQQVRKYEAGQNRISASMLHQVAGIFGVSLSYFFTDFRPQNGSEPPVSARADTEMANALNRIDDAEVRFQLAALIEAIEGFSRKS